MKKNYVETFTHRDELKGSVRGGNGEIVGRRMAFKERAMAIRQMTRKVQGMRK